MNIKDKLIIWLFGPYLASYKVIEVKGFGIFLVDNPEGQRETLYIEPYKLWY